MQVLLLALEEWDSLDHVGILCDSLAKKKKRGGNSEKNIYARIRPKLARNESLHSSSDGSFDHNGLIAKRYDGQHTDHNILRLENLCEGC